MMNSREAAILREWRKVAKEFYMTNVTVLDNPKNETVRADVAAAFNSASLPRSVSRRADIGIFLDKCIAEPRSDSGIELLDKGVLEVILCALRTAIKRNPDDTDALCAMGFGLLSLGKNREALEYFELGLAIDYDSPRLFKGQGCALARIGDYPAARIALKHCLYLDPDNLHANRMLGMVEIALVHRDEALAALERAVEVNPRDIVAYCWMSGILRDKERYGEADSMFQKGCEIGRERAFGRDMPNQCYP